MTAPCYFRYPFINCEEAQFFIYLNTRLILFFGFIIFFQIFLKIQVQKNAVTIVLQR